MPKAPQPKTLETQPIALAWQPESRRHFAVGCVDGRVEIHSTKHAQPLARVWHGDRGRRPPPLERDGRRRSRPRDGAVCCWDTNGGAKAWKAKGRGDKVTAMLSTRGLLAVGDDGRRDALVDARPSGDRGPGYLDAAARGLRLGVVRDPRRDTPNGRRRRRTTAPWTSASCLKSIGETDPFEDELLSCCVTPHSVVAGTATGPLLVWNART